MRVKVRFWVVLFMCTIFSVDSFAQRVYVDASGNAVIDCSGMPEGSVKSASELSASKTVGGRVRRHLQNNQQGSHITGTHGTAALYVNAKVSRKFIVAPKDARTMSWAAASGWDAAANGDTNGNTGTASSGCASYSVNGLGVGSWRLPTQRELMIIYAHKGQLEKVGSFAKFSSSDYLSATEDSSSNSLIADFSNSYVRAYPKAVRSNVRCIYDL